MHNRIFAFNPVNDATGTPESLRITASLKGNIFYLTCPKYNKKAIDDASNLVYDKTAADFYSFIESELRDIYQNYTDLKPYQNTVKKDKIPQRISYVSNFLGYKIYLIFKKIDELYNNHNFSNVMSNLSPIVNTMPNTPAFDYFTAMNYTTYMIDKDCATFIGEVNSNLDLFSDINSFLTYIYQGKKNIRNNTPDLCFAINTAIYLIHRRLQDISQNITDLCQITEMQNYPELLISFCNIYKELKCFLPKEKRINISDYLKDKKDEEQTVSRKRPHVDAMEDIVRKLSKIDDKDINMSLLRQCISQSKEFFPQEKEAAETSITAPASQSSIHGTESQKSDEEASHTPVISSMDRE